MTSSQKQTQKNSGGRSFPHLTYLANVHPRLHFCRDAALMRLSGGVERLVYSGRSQNSDVYGLYLNGVPLVEAHIDNCPTCGTLLWAGYGDGLINEGECNAVRNSINSGYSGLKQSCDYLAPIVGLMKSGLYLVADFDLFPVQHTNYNDYFWDVPKYNGELHFDHWYVGGWRASYHQPLYLAPSQRASQMNPARVDEYRRRIQEGDTFPRAIALYMNGGVALLLDGHHKAAACAAEGVPVKTLVIFQVEADEAIDGALNEKKRLYLQDEFGPFYSCHPLSICDGQGSRLGVLNCMQGKGNKLMEVQEREKVEWGRVPDEYRTERFNDYPNAGLLASISELQPDRIRGYIESEMKKAKDTHDMEIIKLLRVYAKLFPEGKWLSPSERAWLSREDQEFNPTEIWGAPI